MKYICNPMLIFCFLCVPVCISSVCEPAGFPLDKAVSYAKLRNPLLINDLNMQYYIQDRYVNKPQLYNSSTG